MSQLIYFGTPVLEIMSDLEGIWSLKHCRLYLSFPPSWKTKKLRAQDKLFPALPSPYAQSIVAGTQKKKAGNTRHWQLACAGLAQFTLFFFVINMRTNRFFFNKKGQKEINTEAETAVQETQEMGSDVSTANYQKNSSENDASSEMEKSKRPRTENIKSAKPGAVAIKRRRSYSECDNLSIERKFVCKKLRVNQLYTDYCGRNSFMAAFFRLLGECLQSCSFTVSFKFTRWIQTLSGLLSLKTLYTHTQKK